MKSSLNLKRSKIMKVVESAKRKREHNRVVVDKITYLRNEDFEFDFQKNEWVREKLQWSIGNLKGEGPFVEPKGPLDNIGMYTSSELEKMFKTNETCKK